MAHVQPVNSRSFVVGLLRASRFDPVRTVRNLVLFECLVMALALALAVLTVVWAFVASGFAGPDAAMGPQQFALAFFGGPAVVATVVVAAWWVVHRYVSTRVLTAARDLFAMRSISRSTTLGEGGPTSTAVPATTVAWAVGPTVPPGADRTEWHDDDVEERQALRLAAHLPMASVAGGDLCLQGS